MRLRLWPGKEMHKVKRAGGGAGQCLCRAEWGGHWGGPEGLLWGPSGHEQGAGPPRAALSARQVWSLDPFHKTLGPSPSEKHEGTCTPGMPHTLHVNVQTQRNPRQPWFGYTFYSLIIGTILK